MLRISIILLLFFVFTESWSQTADSVIKKKKSQIAENRIDLAALKSLLFFRVENIGKVRGRAIALYANSGLLHYVFMDSTGKVEFSYPVETDEETPGFTIDTTKNNLSLSFANKSAHYRVYELPNKIGVEATIGGILYEQIGVLSSKKGSLKELLKAKLDNLIIR